MTAPTVYATAVVDLTNTVTTVISDTQSGICLTKWAQGGHDAAYFEQNGTTFSEASFNVSEEGIYSIYAMDVAGNETVIDISVSTALAAGSIATDPASGFTRYDDETNQDLFTYVNTEFVQSDIGNVNSTLDISQDSSVSFTMDGTQFCLLTQRMNDNINKNKEISVYIDGVFIQTFTAPQTYNEGNTVFYVSPMLSD